MAVETRDTGEERTSSEDVPLEGSPRRRLLISLFIGATLVAILCSFVPASTPGATPVRAVTQPYLLATGLDQSWGMFAPNPQRRSTAVVAQVERRDGTTVDYTVPHSIGIGAFWDYRWLKYADQLSLKTDKLRERRAYVRWVLDRDRRAGGTPGRVTLLLTSTPLLPPGDGPDTGPTGRTPFYSVTVGGSR